MDLNHGNYESHYSKDSFWKKLLKEAKKAGKKVVYAALLGYYALQNPNVPTKAKAKIYAALGYLILPIDLVPDFVPALGYGDDLVALLFAIGQVMIYVNADVRNNALKKVEELFGPLDANDKDIIEIDTGIKQAETEMKAAAAAEQSDPPTGEMDLTKK
ncbi:MAG: YkvA family protein [Clostridia bacterium]